MPEVVRFVSRRHVDVVDYPRSELQPGLVRIETLYSGISAGTELTAYRGTNPYLNSVWDPTEHLFLPGREQAPAYPLEGWGYSEVGRVAEVGEDVRGLRAGDLVWGIWGHRSEVVLPGESVRSHVLGPDCDPLVGTFVRVGAVALNAVLAAQVGPGSVCAIMGQGVIGLLATRFADLSGATVYAVDPVESRRRRAVEVFGADEVFEPSPSLALDIRHRTDFRGADVVIELSGDAGALHEAVRLVGPEGTVVAAGFYQGDAAGLFLGQEFHHNRVTLRCSQISSLPAHLQSRWDRERLQQVAAAHLSSGKIDATSLVSHRFALEDADDAYRLLDDPTDDVMQVVFECPAAAR